MGQQLFYFGDSDVGIFRAGSRPCYSYGVPGGIRTPDPLLRRQPLYPLSYRDE